MLRMYLYIMMIEGTSIIATMILVYTSAHLVIYVVIINAKQKHLGCKKAQGQSEATLQTGMWDQNL